MVISLKYMLMASQVRGQGPIEFQGFVCVYAHKKQDKCFFFFHTLT